MWVMLFELSQQMNLNLGTRLKFRVELLFVITASLICGKVKVIGLLLNRLVLWQINSVVSVG